MKVMIQSINFDATEKLEEYIIKKTKKVEKFFDEIMALDETDDLHPIRLHARTLFELKENTTSP